MQTRIEYLMSGQGGNMRSDYLALKKQLQILIRALDNELLDHLPAHQDDILFAETEESADAETRKNDRYTYMKAVEKWVRLVKKVTGFSIQKAKEPQAAAQADYHPLQDEDVPSQHLVAPLAPSLPELSLASITPQRHAIKRLLNKMEEARQAERYLEVYEIRTGVNTGKVQIDTLSYRHETGTYQLDHHPDTEPTFKIVTGGRRLKDHDDVSAAFNQEEYFALQELGATTYRETTLIAKLINEYGKYRRSVINSAIRFHIRTDTWMVKEQICQQAISRLRALQDLESGYGADTAAVNHQIASYEKKIIALILQKEGELEELNAIELGSEQQVYSAQEMQWQKDVLANHLKGLQDDLVNSQELTNPAILVSQKTLAHWLLKQSEHIIESAKLEGELVDISGKKGISLGRFSMVTAKAFDIVRTFQFPPNKRVYPAHQGIFDPEQLGSQLLLSSAELASGERDTRDVLFAFACVKAGFTKEGLADIMELSLAKEVAHRGYGRISKLWQRDAKREAIHEVLEGSEVLNTVQTVWALYYALRDKVRSTNESYAHAAKKVFADMGRAVKDSVVGAAEEITDVTVQFGRNIQRDFTYNNIVLPPTLNQAVQALHHHSHSTVENKLATSSECIVETMPAFQPWNPNTLYSVVDNFLEQFGGFFITKYEASPFIWTMASLLGALSGATALAAPAVKSLLLKCGCPEGLANGFVNVSQVISEATTNSPFFQMVGTGSTVQQGLFVLLDTMATGADSFTVQAIAELKRNLPIAVCVIGGSTFGGWALGNIEMFRAEFGTVPLIAEFFTGLKFAGFGYEALVHEPGEKSALANTVASGMTGVYNLVRAAASFLQLIVVVPGSLLTCHPDVAKIALANFLRPSLDLTDTGVRLLVSSLDVLLRCSTTMGRGAKAVVKAGLETPINMLAKLTRIVELESLSKAIVRAKSNVGTSFDDNLARPLHNVSRTVRRGYATLMTQDDMYLGANPLRLSNSSHSFCQTIRKRNWVNQQAILPILDDEREIALLSPVHKK